jgi:peptidoglycan/LPS O-acetylase OafA/YrhL
MGLDGEWMPLGTSVYWSLAIEEQFYIVWPVVVLMASPRTLAKICVTLIVASLIARSYLAATDAHPILIYTNTVTRMDTLAIGALVAVAARDAEWWASLQRHVGWMFAVALGTLALLWASIGAFAEYHPLMQTAGFTALAVLFAALIAHVSAARVGSPTARVFSSAALRSLGKYSYAMYLFHETIAVVVVPRLPFGEVHALWAQFARFAVLMPITVVAAVLSWHLFEKHFLALKRFFPGTATPRREPAPRALTR